MVVASDGSCLGGPGGPIGWGWVRDDGAWLSNGFWTGTNQRAELWGLLSVLLAHPTGNIKIQMDSQYALNIGESWAAKWAKQGWTLKGNRPVQNLDLVMPIYEQVSIRTDPLEFEWVKGHSGHGLNEEADKRAREGSKRASKVSGDVESLTLYRDVKGRHSNKFQNRMMVDVIDGKTGTPPNRAEMYSLFDDIAL